jgi:hypothetical protein
MFWEDEGQQCEPVGPKAMAATRMPSLRDAQRLAFMCGIQLPFSDDRLLPTVLVLSRMRMKRFQANLKLG